MYVARLSVGDLPLTADTRTVAVVEGWNHLDWSFEGGTLSVSIEGWNQASPVTVTFQQIQEDGTGVRQSTYTLRPPADSRLEIAGLAQGDYVLRAQQQLPDKSILVASPKEVKIEIGRGADVSLRLESHAFEVLVLTATGQPIADAVVHTQHLGTLSQVRPGVFQSKAAMAAGDSLLVLANGYAASCALAPASSQVVVTLTPSVPTTVEVHSSSRYGVVPGFVTSTTMPCPVELMALPATALGSETGQGGIVISRFTLSHLPPVETLLYAAAPRSAGTPLTRDDRGVVVITVR